MVFVNEKVFHVVVDAANDISMNMKSKTREHHEASLRVFEAGLPHQTAIFFYLLNPGCVPW
jgi:hypothetical protein